MGPSPFLEQSSAVKFPSLFEPPPGGMGINMNQDRIRIRLAVQEDMAAIMAVFAQARAAIAALGIDQWQDGYPQREIIEKDKNLTPIQVQRLINRTKELIQYNLLHKEISSIKGISKEVRQKKHDAIDKITGISKQSNNEIYKNCKKTFFIKLLTQNLIYDILLKEI